MPWNTPKQNRTAILKRFPKQTEVYPPCLMDINGENEWVNNYIKFGDLITEQMGVDAGEFYFEQLYEMLSLSENLPVFDEDIEQEEKHEEVKSEVKPSGSKSRQRVRANSKRLF